jgi:murein DD-endopeptidase MepM/ murein hydrolase activator NlpD
MRRGATRSWQELRHGAAMIALGVACAAVGVIPALALDRITIDDDGAGVVDADVRQLASFRLTVPVVGVTKRNLVDTYNQRRGIRPHEALDIPAPRGTQVIAAGNGRVVKLFRSLAGGLTVYQFDPSERFAYYYAHLDHYAQGLTEGTILKRGDAIGAVGSTGNARDDSPHLHFAIFKLGPEKKWWKGSPINPFPLLN